MYAEYLKEHRQDLDFDIYKDLIEQLVGLGVYSITFTGGGEPLMNPRFNEMADLAFNAGLQVGLITNGVKLNEVIDPYRFTFIRVSLDSSNEATYEKVKGKPKFQTVLKNVRGAVRNGATVGLSYVVCADNFNGVTLAKEIAKSLKVEYIQFKPAWINGRAYDINSIKKNNGEVIVTERFKAGDNTPCLIAGLVGVVGADANTYFCCQFRGVEKYSMGSLTDFSFEALLRRRMEIVPDISKCPMCRYMNYAKKYSEIVTDKNLIFKHRYFL